MYHSFKNLPIKLNGVEILASNAELSWQNTLSPSYLVGDRGTRSVVPANGIDGSLKLNYYITGNDYIKTFINNDTGFLSGNVGGLYFSSGLLKSYTFSCTPNAVVVPSAEISFFEEIKGTFSATSPPPNTGYNYLNMSDVSLNGLAGYSSETLSAVNSVNFAYLTKISPYYDTITGDQDVGISITPKRLLCNERQLSTEIICDSLTNNLLFSGSNLGIKITLGHPSLPTLNEYYLCSGKIVSKNISSSEGSTVKTNIGVIQYFTEEDPVISGLWSTTWPPTPNSFIRISGRNLTNTNSVWAQDREITNFSVLSDILVSGTLPNDPIDGNLVVYTNGGKAAFAYTTTQITPGSNHVVLQGQTPVYTGQNGEWMVCSGTGLSRTTGVYFTSINSTAYNLTGEFRYLGDDFLAFRIATGVYSNGSTSPRVRFFSKTFNTFATLDNPIAYAPVITGFSPSSGLSGSTINVYGYSFPPTPSIKFNNINGLSVSVASDRRSLTVRVPTGNVYGYISAVDDFSQTSYSSSKFLPVVTITGIHPQSAKENDAIRISGENFQSGLMYRYPDGKFKVGFGDRISTGFFWASGNLLTGYVPSGASTSPIYIYANDGATMYNSSVSFTRRYPAPSVVKMVPNPAISGQSYYGYVEGQNLFSPSMVQLSGLTSSGPAANTGTMFFIVGSNLVPDVLGKRINIYNYTGFRGPTGNFGTQGVTFSGNFRLRVITPEGTGVATTIFKVSTP